MRSDGAYQAIRGAQRSHRLHDRGGELQVHHRSGIRPAGDDHRVRRQHDALKALRQPRGARQALPQLLGHKRHERVQEAQARLERNVQRVLHGALRSRRRICKRVTSYCVFEASRGVHDARHIPGEDITGFTSSMNTSHSSYCQNE